MVEEKSTPPATGGVIPLFKVFTSPKAGEALERVLKSGYLGQGPEVQRFEEALRDFWWGRGEAVTVNSGTSALDLAYHLCGLRRGDLVLSTPLTCTATNLPLLHRGVDIEWYDCDPLSGCPHPESVLERAEQSAPKAIVLVSWGGRDLGPTVEAVRRGLKRSCPVVVDYAHAGPLPPPLLADYTCYSFQAIKHLTTGDGGALVCADPRDTQRARLLRWYGLDRTSSTDFRCKQDITDPGFKYHLNDLAAALGLANLREKPSLAWRWATHVQNAEALFHAVKEIPYLDQPPFDSGGAYWVYPVLVKPGGVSRESLLRHLADRGIGAGRVHRRNDTHPCFSGAGDLPGVTHFDDHSLALPCGWWVGHPELDRILHALKDFKA